MQNPHITPVHQQVTARPPFAPTISQSRQGSVLSFLGQLTVLPPNRALVSSSASPAMLAPSPLPLEPRVMVRPMPNLSVLKEMLEVFRRPGVERRAIIANCLVRELSDRQTLAVLLSSLDSGGQRLLLSVLDYIWKNCKSPAAVMAQEILVRPEILVLLPGADFSLACQMVNILLDIVLNPFAPEMAGRAGSALLAPEVFDRIKDVNFATRLNYVKMLQQLIRNKVPGMEDLPSRAEAVLLSPEIIVFLNKSGQDVRENVIEGLALVAKVGTPDNALRAIAILTGPETNSPLYDIDTFVLAMADIIKNARVVVAERAMSFLLQNSAMTHHASKDNFVLLIKALEAIVGQQVRRPKEITVKALEFLALDPIVQAFYRNGVC